MMQDFQFAYPYLLLATLVFVVVLGVASVLKRKKQKHKILSTFSADTIATINERVSERKQWMKLFFRLAVIAMLGTAIARPQWGFTEREFTVELSNVVFVLDVSKSMLASDLEPTRLDRAKLFILDFIEQLNGERVGLVAFAGEAFLQCPLTLDYLAFTRSLRSLSTGSLSRGGSDIAQSLEEAVLLFPQGTEQKVLVLLTDGEDLAEEGIKKAKELSGEGVRIYTVGVGSEQGDVIMIRGENGSSDVLRDRNGKPVVSKLDRNTLEEIAQQTGGFYLSLATAGNRTTSIYDHGIKPQEPSEEEKKKRRVYNEWFILPLAFALLFLILETVLKSRRNL